MTIGADIAAALPELRAEAESLHRDACTLQRKTGASVPSPVNGATEAVWETYWTGKCWVRNRDGADGRAFIGGEPVGVAQRLLCLPMSAPVPDVGHRALVTSVTDPSMVDFPLYVTNSPEGTHMVQRRIPVEATERAQR